MYKLVNSDAMCTVNSSDGKYTVSQKRTSIWQSYRQWHHVLLFYSQYRLTACKINKMHRRSNLEYNFSKIILNVFVLALA